MKKFIVVLFALLFYGNVFAAGTCTETDWEVVKDYRGNKVGTVLTILCTHHTDNSLSAPLASNGDESAMQKLSGQYIYKIKYIPSSPAPTDETDLIITDSDGLSLLGANGTNFIDETTKQETLGKNTFLGISTYLWPVYSEIWTISTTGNAVSGSKFYLKFYGLYADR